MLIVPTKVSGHRIRSSSPVLGLVSVTYSALSSIALTFNQPIDITHVQGPEVEVNDQPNNTALAGSDGPAVRVDAFTVRIELEPTGPSTGGVGVSLTASDNTRIRTIPGAQSWAGVTDLELPFG
jgi:hypothetical protein